MCYVIDLLDVLKANYDGKHTISLTDPESRWMMDKKENIGLNYNYQVAVDSKNGMVVGQYLTQNATDSKELFEMLHEIKIQMGINPKVLVADNGYMNDNATNTCGLIPICIFISCNISNNSLASVTFCVRY